jgi:hypothetical protein
LIKNMMTKWHSWTCLPKLTLPRSAVIEPSFLVYKMLCQIQDKYLWNFLWAAVHQLSQKENEIIWPDFILGNLFLSWEDMHNKIFTVLLSVLFWGNTCVHIVVQPCISRDRTSHLPKLRLCALWTLSPPSSSQLSNPHPTFYLYDWLL